MQKVEEKDLNGLTVSKLEAFVNEIKSKPEAAQAVNGPWRTRVEWQGGLRSKAYMRNHVASFDEPEGLGAADTAASAHEHVLSAVGACMMTGLVFQATRRGIKIHNAEIALEGTFGDIKNWAGLTDENTPGYPEIKAKIYIKADADKAYAVEAWKDLPAIRNRRVYVVSDELLNTPGPPLVKGAMALWKLLHSNSERER